MATLASNRLAKVGVLSSALFCRMAEVAVELEGMDLAIELLAKVSSTALHDVAVAVIGL